MVSTAYAPLPGALLALNGEGSPTSIVFIEQAITKGIRTMFPYLYNTRFPRGFFPWLILILRTLVLKSNDMLAVI